MIYSPTAKLASMRENEDPRVSFSTPEFKKAQRTFQDNLKVRILHPMLSMESDPLPFSHTRTVFSLAHFWLRISES